MESMTQAPYLLPGAREGYRIGDKSVVDSMMYDGLFCAFDQVRHGRRTEKYAASAGLAREPQDDLAAKSHERAAAAPQGRPLRRRDRRRRGAQRRGDPVVVDTDEGVRPGTTGRWACLRPAFAEAGNITAARRRRRSARRCRP